MKGRFLSYVLAPMLLAVAAPDLSAVESSKPRTSTKRSSKSKTVSPKGKTSDWGKAYRWVDKNGVTHYGDTIPAEYSQQARTQLNGLGVPVQQYPRQLTPAEAAEAQVTAAAEQKRLQHDQFLLTTYTSSSDIEQLRDERLALIDGQITHARNNIDSVQTRIGAAENRMQNFKPYSANPKARVMPQTLADEAVGLIREKVLLENLIQLRETEKVEMRAKFNNDAKRYRELVSARKAL